MAAIGVLTKRYETLHPSFGIVSDRPLLEVDGRVIRLTHLATGADIVCIRNQDPNKVMAITFPTLPQNSRGTAHVLEHMVFRGSRRYPVAQPFSLLLRGSMHTHLNATTQADRTSFFFASTNSTDFINLTDVCLDALLHPLLTEDAFDDEAWHVMRTREGRAIYGGIVLNEMRGHASAPASVLAEETRRALFPDTVYRHAYGGVAAEIPSLTVAAVRAFHKRFYVPGKALIFLWGDDDFEDRLAQIDRHFAGVACKAAVRSAVKEQPAFTEPEVLRRPFAGGVAPLANRAWALSHSVDAEVRLERSIMARVLTGRTSVSMAQMLRGMEADPVFCSFAQDDRHPVLTIGYGLGGAHHPDPAAAIQALLERTAIRGIDPNILRQTLNDLEFELTENDSTPIPQGLAMFRRCIGAWRHGGDPAEVLGWHGPFARIKEKYRNDPMALSRRISVDLLENAHRVDVMLVPDPNLADVRERKQAVGLARHALKMTSIAPSAKQGGSKVLSTTAPSSLPPAMPKLARSDLPTKIKRDQIVEVSLGSAQGLGVKIADHGIAYLDLGWEINQLPDDLILLVPLYERLILEKAHASPVLAAEMADRTGGITTQHWSAGGCPPHATVAHLFLRGKARLNDLSKLVSVMAQVFAGGAQFDVDAVRRMILSETARQSARLVSAGHLVADLRVRAGLHRAATVAEMLDGITQLAALRRLGTLSPEAIAAELRILHQRLLISARPVIAIGSSNPDQINLLLDLPEQLGLSGADDAAPRTVLQPQTEAVGFPTETGVNTVGLAANLPASHSWTGAMAVLAKALQTGLLWDSVRVAGGAYGALCRHDAGTGALSFISARDPHILRTIDCFRSAPNWLRQHADAEMMEQCVAGAVGEATRPVLAGQATLASVQRHLQGQTHARQQADRDALLSTGRRDALTLADALEEAFQVERLTVLAPKDALSGALRERPGLFSLQPAP